MEPQNPFTNNQPNISQPAVIKSNSYLSNILKSKVILVLAVLILVESFVVFKAFTSKPTNIAQLPQSQIASQVLPLTVGPLGGAKIALTIENKNYKIGERVPVKIRVFSGGYYSDGVDLVLKYDPKVLEVTPEEISGGNIFQNFPVKNVDSSSGTIQISAISSTSGESFNGIGDFVTINFRTISIGSSEVNVVYTPNQTDDSNVIQQQESIDMLTDVINATINVTAEGGSSPDTSACAPRSYQSCVDSKGQTGSFWCTSLLDSQSCTAGCFTQESSNDLGCSVISN
jgi:hypothetical protein